MSETLEQAAYRHVEQGLPMGAVRRGMGTAVLEAWCQVRGGCVPEILKPKILFLY